MAIAQALQDSDTSDRRFRGNDMGKPEVSLATDRLAFGFPKKG
jgi:hypothetical protein